MIRTILTVIGLMVVSFVLGMVWQANPDVRPGVLSWGQSLFVSHCPKGQLCVPVPSPSL